MRVRRSPPSKIMMPIFVTWPGAVPRSRYDQQLMLNTFTSWDDPDFPTFDLRSAQQPVEAEQAG